MMILAYVFILIPAAMLPLPQAIKLVGRPELSNLDRE